MKLLTIIIFSLCLISCSTEKQNKGNSQKDLATAPSIIEENDACICTKDYRPVCGANGQTYPNACQAECDGVMEYDEGSCR